MDPNWQISVVRTVVAPLFIGVTGQTLIFLGGDPGPILRVAAIAFIAVGWYVFARLSQYFHPQLGCLLFISARPHYDEHDDLMASLRRTVVPLIVAAGLACLVAPLLSGSPAAYCLVGAALIYYGTLRWIEEHAAPDSTARGAAGWLLGARAVPHY